LLNFYFILYILTKMRKRDRVAGGMQNFPSISNVEQNPYLDSYVHPKNVLGLGEIRGRIDTQILNHRIASSKYMNMKQNTLYNTSYQLPDEEGYIHPGKIKLPGGLNKHEVFPHSMQSYVAWGTSERYIPRANAIMAIRDMLARQNGLTTRT